MTSPWRRSEHPRHYGWPPSAFRNVGGYGTSDRSGSWCSAQTGYHRAGAAPPPRFLRVDRSRGSFGSRHRPVRRRGMGSSRKRRSAPRTGPPGAGEVEIPRIPGDFTGGEVDPPRTLGGCQRPAGQSSWGASVRRIRTGGPENRESTARFPGLSSPRTDEEVMRPEGVLDCPGL